MKKILFSAAIALSLIAQQAFAACSCEPPSLQESWDTHNTIFNATVIDLEIQNPGEYLYTLAVKYTWKGTLDSYVQLASKTETCDVVFQMKETYVIYANMKNGVLTTSTCDGTKNIRVADADIGFLQDQQSH